MIVVLLSPEDSELEPVPRPSGPDQGQIQLQIPLQIAAQIALQIHCQWQPMMRYLGASESSGGIDCCLGSLGLCSLCRILTIDYRCHLAGLPQ